MRPGLVALITSCWLHLFACRASQPARHNTDVFRLQNNRWSCCSKCWLPKSTLGTTKSRQVSPTRLQTHCRIIGKLTICRTPPPFPIGFSQTGASFDPIFHLHNQAYTLLFSSHSQYIRAGGMGQSVHALTT